MFFYNVNSFIIKSWAISRLFRCSVIVAVVFYLYRFFFYIPPFYLHITNASSHETRKAVCDMFVPFVHVCCRLSLVFVVVDVVFPFHR